jgi:hypothetical protein
MRPSVMTNVDPALWLDDDKDLREVAATPPRRLALNKSSPPTMLAWSMILLGISRGLFGVFTGRPLLGT